MKSMNQLKHLAGGAICASVLGLSATTHAALFFWDNDSSDGLYSTAANWNPNGNPGAADLAVANNAGLAAITINGNWSVDSLRTGDGGNVNHTSGILTIANGAGPDNGLWVPEFGPAPSTYTLNGGIIVITDPNDGFMVARGGGSQGTFNFTAGSITNTLGDTHIGLDGIPYWYQSSGYFRGAGVQIGRFASPYALVELSGNAAWNVGLVLLADGHGVFNPRNAGLVDLKIIGPNVSFNSTGLVMQDEGQLTFDGQSVGISTMHLGGGQFLLNNGKLFLNNLPTPSGLNQTNILIDGIGSITGPDAQFDNAPNGTIYDAGSIDWQITYTSSNIFLVSVPDCVAPSISVQPVSKSVVLGQPTTFSVGAGGTALLYQWQTNGVDISGANGSSYTIGAVAYSDALTYRVIVSNVCSGLSVTSSNATLTVLDPWVFYAWTDGGSDNIYSNANNWSPTGVPTGKDFAFVNITNEMIINGNFSADTLRTGGGSTILHTNGTLTIVNGLWFDNGLYIGDNGDNGGGAAYTLNGGKIVIQDPDGFQVGRALPSVATFNFISGNITNTSGDTHVGLDGVGTWNQSGGVFKAGGVQIGRFASSNGVVNLSGTAKWDATLVLLADGHGADFTPIYGAGNRNPNPASLNIIGPTVTYDSTGLVMMQEGNLTFNGAGGGLSTMNLGGGIFLINGGKLYVTNAPAPVTLGQEIVLMRNIGTHNGANDQFPNAPNGTTYNTAGGGQWTLNYRPLTQATNIVLVATAVPAPITITNTTVSGGNATLVFSAGASDTTASFVVQSASVVSGPYADVSPAATITNPSSGVFQAVTPVNGAIRFYRVRRQ